MSVLKFSDAYGFHDYAIHFEGKRFCPGGKGNLNVQKLASYIPLVGSVIGARHMWAACLSYREGHDRSFCRGVMVRSSAECLSLGAIWLLVDFPMTAVRHRQDKRAAYSRI